jgi:hypothetical protein
MDPDIFFLALLRLSYGICKLPSISFAYDHHYCHLFVSTLNVFLFLYHRKDIACVWIDVYYLPLLLPVNMPSLAENQKVVGLLRPSITISSGL